MPKGQGLSYWSGFRLLAAIFTLSIAKSTPSLESLVQDFDCLVGNAIECTQPWAKHFETANVILQMLETIRRKFRVSAQVGWWNMYVLCEIDLFHLTSAKWTLHKDSLRITTHSQNLFSSRAWSVILPTPQPMRWIHQRDLNLRERATTFPNAAHWRVKQKPFEVFD